MVKVRQDLTGRVFGRLTVLGQAEDYISPKGQHFAQWLCQCSCGSESKNISTGNLKNGSTISCGCSRIESISKTTKTHGASRTSEYHSWSAMISRCTSENNPDYESYGGRGITVCSRWADCFENFLEDMGDRPEGTSLDRIDVNGNYEPENCRWATGSDQCFNKRISNRNTSGRTGVYWHKRIREWSALIVKDGERTHLGYFTNFEDAVAARESAEIELFGYTKK